MDPFTHAVLGATIARAGFHHRLGWRGMAVGAVVAMSPDLDIVAGWLGGTLAEWEHHRGVTHSVFVAALAGPLIGRVLAARSPPMRRDWMALCFLALASHGLLDMMTSYGTQLLAPLSRHRFAIDALAVIDLGFTSILLLSLISRRAALAGLGLAWVYALGGWALNGQAEARAARGLGAGGAPPVVVDSWPTLLQPLWRRVVARLPDGQILIGFHSALDERPIAWRPMRLADGPPVATVAATPKAALFEWFANGRVFWRTAPDGDGTLVVEATDYR
ncbi:MAG: metal-dependent hydrolase, partial [Alphaproteobacteria bacterium]|nr:metal-dependent hydrolase [Alphaproteobacteria bacterium]